VVKNCRKPVFNAHAGRVQQPVNEFCFLIGHKYLKFKNCRKPAFNTHAGIDGCKQIQIEFKFEIDLSEFQNQKCIAKISSLEQN